MLPSVITDLRIPLQEGLDDASLAVSGYFLSYALGIAVMGRVSDAFGRSTAYLAALAVFAVGSAFAAASSELGPEVADVLGAFAGGGGIDRSFAALYAFVAARLVQGFGAGAMLPVSLALVGDLFPAGRRSFPLGVVSGVDTAGWVLGHVYGGVFVQFLPWPGIFWSNLPVAAIAFVAIRRGLRGLDRPRQTFDWRSAAALAVALIAIDLALSGSETGTSGLVLPDRMPASAIALLVVGVLAGSLFVRLERGSASPLFDLSRLGSGAWVASAINFLVGACLIATLVSVPLVMNAAGARSSEAAALASGMVLATLTIPMALAAVAGGRLARRARWVTVAGLALATIGFILVAHVAPEAARQALAVVGALPGGRGASELGDLLALEAALALSGTGLGLTIAPLATVVIDASPSQRRGTAASLVVALRILGMMVGTSVLTTYGVRRWAALAPVAFAGIPLDRADRLADTAFALTAAIARDMVLSAAAVSLIALVLAFRLPRRRHAARVS